MSTSVSSADPHSIVSSRVSSGIEGLDVLLDGGFLPGRAYLVRGGPGTGKTQMGLRFLTGGATNANGNGESADAGGRGSLFITLGEKPEQIRMDAEAFDLDLDGVEFLDLSPSSDYFVEGESYDVFLPAEVERGPITDAITERVEETPPDRVLIDSMTQLQYLAPDAEQFRKQALAFIRYLSDHGATILFTAEHSEETPDTALQFLSDGIVHLYNEGGRRHVEISKFRGSDYRSGIHTVTLGKEGMQVYPKLKVEARRRTYSHEVISSGVPELDELLNGGIDRGTVTLLTGSSGVGKTTLGLQFMKEAAGRGEQSVVYAFEEVAETLVHRCQSVNIPVEAMIDRGRLRIEVIRPGELTIDEFTYRVGQEVEEDGTRFVMVDGVAGLKHSLVGEELDQNLHTLGKHVVNCEASLLITDEIREVTGDFQPTSAAISYIADNLIFLRYLEMRGELRKAIGVLKKRTSDFEKTLREFAITRYGIKVGEPLTQLRGILRGQPEWSESPSNGRRAPMNG